VRKEESGLYFFMFFFVFLFVCSVGFFFFFLRALNVHVFLFSPVLNFFFLANVQSGGLRTRRGQLQKAC